MKKFGPKYGLHFLSKLYTMNDRDIIEKKCAAENEPADLSLSGCMERSKMEQREIMEQVNRLHSDNPTLFIKIRDIFDAIFAERELGSAQDITDREFDRIQYRFRDSDVPFIWCATKEDVYQLQKAIRYHRSHLRDRGEDYLTAKKQD